MNLSFYGIEEGWIRFSFIQNLIPVIVSSIFGSCFLLLSSLHGLAFLIISIISYFGHAEPAAFWQQSAVPASVTSRLAVPSILQMAKVLGYE